ncbi:MAG: hypothetical protein WCH40_04085 [Verrucomicrobiales bacterium]
MLKQFVPLEAVDTDEMLSLVDAMEEVVEALDEGTIPNTSDYTTKDLSGYVLSLVQSQEHRTTSLKPGYWCVVNDQTDMPGDARVDFVFRPTYAAVATLSRTLCDFGSMAMETPRFLSALTRGMKFATYRGLAGHGYESDQGAMEALRILSLGKVPWLLERQQNLCPKLLAVIRDVSHNMQRRLTTGAAIGVWGQDLSEGFRQSIETLMLINSPKFMQSIAEAKKDPSVTKRKEWKW